ncbi:hypothetical protein IQ265_12765 [Nodosilinea sp. LEGE 06152]|uniref:hypothetical protein n=1 Tax=Nodosilinea sp. LEGE 06152 TaxID=2777966 RepID=UPI00187E9FBA|nr:hypothetical protein [Nodosilinea sp. LEGE 06152]MBE9157691.1 hypothetical protein [Nodosilinea sp. LEGE 06152]
MAWRNLGTVAPDLLEWRELPQQALGNLFRIRQSWNGDWPGTGAINLAIFYDGGGRYGFEQIYSDPKPRMVIFTPPQLLTDAGFLVRRFAVRFSSRTRVYAVANWQVSVDEWVDNTEDDEPAQLIDGGTYGGL